jgi:Arc/MetJ family transcription regulator
MQRQVWSWIMRTTITLDERLLAQLKRRAAEQGTSVSKPVEQAVRLFVRSPRVPTAPQAFEQVTFGMGGRFSRHNIDKTSALLEADDLEHFVADR